MFLLNKQRALVHNTRSLNSLYSEIKVDLGLPILPGQEEIEFSRIANSAISGLTYVAKKLQQLTTRVVLTMRNLAENVFLRYSAIMLRWDKRIKLNLNKIDGSKFGNTSVTIVPKNLLMKRISALIKLHHILNNIESICDSPVKHDSADWRTPEIMIAYRAMTEIGFDANRFNLIGKVSAAYDQSREKNLISQLGYTTHDLLEIISGMKTLSVYAQENSLKHITTRFVDYSDKLTAYEESLNKLDDMDSEELATKKHILDIKLARLWWISHFIKSSYVVAGDVVVDILKLCKIAERCISE
jgi:hypothetical protein